MDWIMIYVVFDLKDILFQGRGWERYGVDLLDELLDHEDLRIDYVVENYSRARRYYPSLFRRKDTEVLEISFLTDGTERLSHPFIDAHDLYHSLKDFPEFHTIRAQLITSVHDISFTFLASYREASFVHLMSENLKYVLNHSDGMISFTRVTQDRLQAHAARHGLKKEGQQFFTIPHGIHSRFKSQSAGNVKQLLKRLAIHKPFILHLGGLEPDKNAECLIRVFEEDSYLMDNYLLVFAGPVYGESLALVERINAQNVPWMCHVGFLNNEDLPPLYAGAELYVSASLDEGFGYCPLEALACGTPVLCSDIPCFREVLQDAAAYFDPRDVNDLIRNLNELLRNRSLRDQKLEVGRERLKGLCWKETARRTVQAYEKVLEIRQATDKVCLTS